MKILIILFGLLIIVMAGALMFQPKQLAGFLLKNSGERWLQVLAVAVRIVMGVTLILYAAASRYPLAFQIIGWIAVVAGVVLAVIPPARFKKMIHWAFSKFGRYTRIAALFAVILGAFLIHAVT